MWRLVGAIATSALALSLVVQPAEALVPGYDSSYLFESAFLTLKPGDSGTFSVFFANAGKTSWVAGSDSQVNLGICAADKVTCNVASPFAAWADGWLSTTAYTSHTKSVVVPGDFSAFTYKIKVPSNVSVGTTARFNGDLVQAGSGGRIHPEGYYQDATVGTAPTPTVSPSPSFGGGGGGTGTGGTTGTTGTTGTSGTTGMSPFGTVVAGIGSNVVAFVTNAAGALGEWLFSPSRSTDSGALA